MTFKERLEAILDAWEKANPWDACQPDGLKMTMREIFYFMLGGQGDRR